MSKRMQTNRRTFVMAIELFSQLGGDWYRGTIGHQNQQGCRRAEGSSGNAVMTAPTAVLVLDVVQILDHPLVPFLPFGAAFGEQRFADVHVTEELFPAVGAKALDKLLIVQTLDEGCGRFFLSALGIRKAAELRLGFFAFCLRRGRLRSKLANLFLELLVGVDRILQIRNIGSAVIKRHTSGAESGAR